jgi:hypothetical protein
MRITINIPDSICKQLRKRAAEEKITVPDLIVRAIELFLAVRSPHAGRQVKLPIVRSKRAGKLRINNSKIYETISFP